MAGGRIAGGRTSSSSSSIDLQALDDAAGEGRAHSASAVDLLYVICFAFAMHFLLVYTVSSVICYPFAPAALRAETITHFIVAWAPPHPAARVQRWPPAPAATEYGKRRRPLAAHAP